MMSSTLTIRPKIKTSNQSTIHHPTLTTSRKISHPHTTSQIAPNLRTIHQNNQN